MIHGIVASGILGRRRNNDILPAPAVFSVPGAWTWFNDPRAINLGSGIVVGALDPVDGDVLVYDMQSTTPVVLFAALQLDDHANPSMVHLDTGTILAAVSAHNAPGLRTFHSSNPDDVSAFGAADNIDTDLGGNTYTYTNLFQLTGEVNEPVYLFFRDDQVSVKHYYMSSSTDGGVTWATRTRIFANGGGNNDNAPYVKIAQNGTDRIDFFLTDGHPNLHATNSIYHCYFQGGVFHKTDGTTVSTPITPSTDLSKVYDGTTTRSWIMAGRVIGGVPVCMFSTYPSTVDHRAHYRKLSGGSWVGSQVCTAGRYLMLAEPYYSGGSDIDPDDINTVVVSREVNGEHQLWRFVTADGGSTWDSGEQITEGPRSFRPYYVQGALDPRLLYMAGDYHDFTVLDTDIKLIDSDKPEVTLDTDPSYSSTKLITNFHEPSGVTALTDYSPAAKTGTFRNNAVIQATNSPFGVACLLLDGNGDTVTYPNSTDWQFGSGDFTIEVWAAPIDYTPGSEDFFISFWRSDNNQRSWGLRNTTAGDLEFLGSNNGTAVTTLLSSSIAGLAADSWHYFAVKRASGVFTLWVDGSQTDSDSTALTFHAATGFLNIGNIQNAATGWSTSSGINGRIGPVRITPGVARTIVLPTKAFPVS